MIKNSFVIGLNVKSLLKYDKLILDLDALNILENKLLFEIKRYDFLESHRIPFKFSKCKSQFENLNI